MSKKIYILCNIIILVLLTGCTNKEDFFAKELNLIDKVDSLEREEATLGEDKVMDMSDFDVSKVSDMSAMFQGIDIDVSDFDVSKVSDMSEMFQGVTIDISEFNISRESNEPEIIQESSDILLKVEELVQQFEFINNKGEN